MSKSVRFVCSLLSVLSKANTHTVAVMLMLTECISVVLSTWKHPIQAAGWFYWMTFFCVFGFVLRNNCDGDVICSHRPIRTGQISPHVITVSGLFASVSQCWQNHIHTVCFLCSLPFPPPFTHSLSSLFCLYCNTFTDLPASMMSWTFTTDFLFVC